MPLPLAATEKQILPADTLPQFGPSLYQKEIGRAIQGKCVCRFTKADEPVALEF